MQKLQWFTGLNQTQPSIFCTNQFGPYPDKKHAQYQFHTTIMLSTKRNPRCFGLLCLWRSHLKPVPTTLQAYRGWPWAMLMHCFFQRPTAHVQNLESVTSWGLYRLYSVCVLKAVGGNKEMLPRGRKNLLKQVLNAAGRWCSFLLTHLTDHLSIAGGTSAIETCGDLVSKVLDFRYQKLIPTGHRIIDVFRVLRCVWFDICCLNGILVHPCPCLKDHRHSRCPYQLPSVF